MVYPMGLVVLGALWGFLVPGYSVLFGAAVGIDNDLEHGKLAVGFSSEL